MENYGTTFDKKQKQKQKQKQTIKYKRTNQKTKQKPRENAIYLWRGLIFVFSRNLAVTFIISLPFQICGFSFSSSLRLLISIYLSIYLSIYPLCFVIICIFCYIFLFLEFLSLHKIKNIYKQTILFIFLIRFIKLLLFVGFFQIDEFSFFLSFFLSF